MDFPTLGQFLETYGWSKAAEGEAAAQAVRAFEKGAESSKDEMNRQAVKAQREPNQPSGPVVVAEGDSENGFSTLADEARLFAGLKSEAIRAIDKEGDKQIAAMNSSAIANQKDLTNGKLIVADGEGEPVNKSNGKLFATNPSSTFPNAYKLTPTEAATYTESMARAAILASRLAEVLGEAEAIAQTTVTEARHVAKAIAGITAESALVSSSMINENADLDEDRESELAEAKQIAQEILDEQSNWLNFIPAEDIKTEFGTLRKGKEYRATEKVGNMQRIWDPSKNSIMMVPTGYLVGIPGYSA